MEERPDRVIEVDDVIERKLAEYQGHDLTTGLVNEEGELLGHVITAEEWAWVRDEIHQRHEKQYHADWMEHGCEGL